MRLEMMGGLAFCSRLATILFSTDWKRTAINHQPSTINHQQHHV
jgi:hypothetical protein